MVFPTVDKEKASTLFHYLAHSTTRLIDRDHTRKQLEKQISRLKKLSGDEVKAQIVELETKIGQAISAEQKLLNYKAQEDVFHAKLKEKIYSLENKLGKLIEGKDSRVRRIQELEEKVKMRLASRNEKVKMINDSIKTLETMHKKLAKTGKNKARLTQVKQRILTLKKKLKEIK
jgi:chromosome segregation ATPase